MLKGLDVPVCLRPQSTGGVGPVHGCCGGAAVVFNPALLVPPKTTGRGLGARVLWGAAAVFNPALLLSLIRRAWTRCMAAMGSCRSLQSCSAPVLNPQGVDSVHGCYGGTAALFNAVNWCAAAPSPSSFLSIAAAAVRSWRPPFPTPWAMQRPSLHAQPSLSSAGPKALAHTAPQALLGNRKLEEK